MVTTSQVLNYKNQGLPTQFQVQCDFCKDFCHKASADIGEAAEKARKEGWATVRTGKLGSPKKWGCPCCLKKPETFY